jgi:4'-phosphopantetheinyl transferase
MTRLELCWPLPPDTWRASSAKPGNSGLSAEVHVWAASLAVSPPMLEKLTATLCLQERQRAARFRFELHRNRFMAGRGLLRTLLAGYLAADPQVLEFEYGAHGKPCLAGSHGGSGWHFNLAHSQDLALLAVTKTAPVGVDVEHIRLPEDADQLVARFFSPRERAAFQRLVQDQKPTVFFNLWTRKEAWLKATGEGIGSRLNEVEVSFLPGEPARLLSLSPAAQSPATWTLHELGPAPGFAAALAVAAEEVTLRCWRWASHGAAT